ncbi:MAG: hypothetical protein P8009_08090 [Gammaproteobacteria bacterium]
MNQDKLFKALILLSLLAYLLRFFQPYNSEAIYGEYLLGNLRYGATTLGYFEYQQYISYFMLGLNIVTAIGLVFYIKSFRIVLIAILFLSVLGVLLNPIIVLTSIDAIVLYIIGLTRGAILYMAFFSTVANHFVQSEQ